MHMNYKLSIVVAVLNEADNILPVCQEIASVLPKLPDSEVILLMMEVL